MSQQGISEKRRFVNKQIDVFLFVRPTGFEPAAFSVGAGCHILSEGRRLKQHQ
jgi:hypothetical protein